MLNLIKLELKKFKIKGNIYAGLICNICILGFICLIFYAERAQGNMAFDNYEMLFTIVNSFVNGTFMIFAGFLISKFIIEEYKNKTINLMFTYPINRKKLLISKVIIVAVFTFFFIVFSFIFVSSSVYLVQTITDTTIGELSSKLIYEQFIRVLISALINSIIALIPLYFGVRKKSVPITMVTSFLIVGFLYSGNREFTLASIIAVPIAIMIAGIIVVYLTIRDIEDKDVVV